MEIGISMKKQCNERKKEGFINVYIPNKRLHLKQLSRFLEQIKINVTKHKINRSKLRHCESFSSSIQRIRFSNKIYCMHDKILMPNLS